MNRIPKHKKAGLHALAGLTLVELSLTVLMTSLIALAVYGTLSNGIRIWQDVSWTPAVEDAAVFFEKITVELKNAFKYPGIKFEGNSSSIGFATIVRDRLEYGETGQGAGESFYVFDEPSGVVSKGQLTISGLFQGRQPSFSPALTKAGNFSFEYYFFDKEKKTYDWQPDWPPQEGTPQDPDMPLAVRMSLTLSERNKISTYHEAFFLLPSGQ